jgi:S-adenosylmethionine decarboxylase
MFGPHLTMDMYGCNKKKLKDVTFVFNFLDELPAMIGMTKIMPPYTFSYSGLKPEDWGVSGIVLIAESHVSLHTFPEKNFVSLDIFSCKDFDVEAAVDIIASKFEAKTYEKNFLMRGRHFPKDILRNRQIIELERERESGKIKDRSE